MDRKHVDRRRDSLGRRHNRGALVFVSVLLHSLLVLFPWQEKSRPVAQPEIPASPMTVVDASQLPQLSVSDSQQLPIALAEPYIPSPAVAVLPPVDTPAELPLDEPVVETSDRLIGENGLEEPLPSENTSTPTASTVPGETSPTTPAITPPNEAKIAADWENFVGHLQLQNDSFESSSLLGIFRIYDVPGQIDQFFYEEEDEDGNRRPKLNVLYKHLFEGQTPEQVLQTVVTPGFSSDTSFKLQPQENFSVQENFPAGVAYQLLQGEVLRYLIIVQFNEHNDSVLILSDSLPEGLTAE